MTDTRAPGRRDLGRTGLSVTALGFGGGPVGWADTPDADTRAASTIAAAWDAGLRYLDTAPFYGHGRSERRLGAFLSSKPRDEFVLSTKVGRLVRPRADGGDPIVFDYSRDGALRSVEESFERLGLERIDILLIHDIDRYTQGEDQPRRYREAVDGAFRAIAELRSQGLVRAIGLGVNEWEVCERLARDVDPDVFLLAGRYTLLEQGAAASFLPLCEERGIGIIIGGPFNSGILVTGDTPGALYQYLRAPPEVREKVRKIAAVCDSHGVPLPAAALQFPLRSKVVGSVIPGVERPEDMAAVAGWFAQEIPEGLWSDLKGEGLVEG